MRTTLRTTSLGMLTVLTLVLAPQIARAEDASAATTTPTPQPTPATPAAKSEAASSEVVRPSEHRTGRGVGFGGDNGLFGRAFEQSLRIRFPILDFMAFNLRGISTMGPFEDGTRWELGGRAELIGHTPVYLNLVRLYGGGGPEIAARVSGPGDKKAAFGGGGHFGFEFFLNPRMSFFTEIGGHGGNALTAGGTAVAGMMFYPFSGP